MHAFSYAAYTLHDRAGTLASLLYKAEMTSVHLTVTPIAQWFMRGSTWGLVYVELHIHRHIREHIDSVI